MRSQSGYLLLSPTDCQNVFAKYSKQDDAAAEAATLAGHAAPPLATSLFTYELFLAAIVHVAARIKRADVPYLSEVRRWHPPHPSLPSQPSTHLLLSMVGRIIRADVRG